MLTCWETDAKSRLCFNEIITELDKLISSDSGYFVLKNEGVTDGYNTVNPTKTPDNHYDTHEADHTTTSDDHHVDATDTDVTTPPSDHHVNATDIDVTTTPNDGTMTADTDFTKIPHDDYINPTIIHDDYINPGMTSVD